MTRGFPGYGRLVVTKESQWSQPEKGLLAGTINSVSKNSIDLRDLAGKDWQVAYDENTAVRPAVNLESGEMIKDNRPRKRQPDFSGERNSSLAGKRTNEKEEDGIKDPGGSEGAAENKKILKTNLLASPVIYTRAGQ